MEDRLKQFIKEGLSQEQIAVRMNITRGAVVWMLRKFKLSTAFKKGGVPKVALCDTCGQDDPKNFYSRQKRMCKKCRNLQNVEKYRAYKRSDIEFFGGKCIRCTYSKCVAALEFHHRNPNEKDPDFKRVIRRSAKARRTELSKCDLLCSNCHREIHEEMRLGY
jgi:hypothetical protein